MTVRYGPATLYMTGIPRATVGGTWVYCKHTRRIKGGVEVCLWKRRIRRRGLAKYRRHWLRHHTMDWSQLSTDVMADLAAAGEKYAGQPYQFSG